MFFLRRSSATACLAAVLASTPLYAADVNLTFQFNNPTSLQSAAGGAEAIIYQGDTTTLSSIVLGDGVFSAYDMPVQKSSLPTTVTNGTATGTPDSSSATPYTGSSSTAEPVATIGASTFFSPYLKVYSIPLSYTFFNDLRVTTSIPYIQRTIKRDGVEFKADGLGDVSLGLEYRWLHGEKLQLSTTADMILPTGDVSAKGTNNGDQLTVPLGSGAFSGYLIQHATYRLTDTVKIFGNAGIRYYTDADYTAYPSVMPVANAIGQKVHEEKGMVFSGMVGTEWRMFTDFAVAGRFSVIKVQEGKQSIDGGSKINSNDSITAGDFSATVKYRIWQNLGASVSGIFPVFTTFDPDVKNPEERTWGVNFSISTFF